MMKNTNLLVILLFALSSSWVSQVHGLRRQGDALNDLRKAKLVGGENSGIGESLFLVAENRDLRVEDEVIILGQEGMKIRDKIEKLPGQPNFGPNAKVSQFGGYVTVDESAGRALYYYFVEANESREDLPLVLWLNGGPGCSSLGYGAMEELGPFRVHSDGKTLYPNIYSWHKAANVLFLESPIGVGFSYSNTSSDYDKLGDGFTASDNYKFLVNWLERFPEYKVREFYIAGESYAGHYVPQLAHQILLHNQKANRSIIDLKGIIIGNAVINGATDDKGMYDFFGSHALISPQLARNIDNWCNFTAPVQSSDCSNALKQSDANTYDIDIDVYNIYGPICFSPNLSIHPKKTSLANFDPCSDNYVHAYLNRPEVQEAMHANVTKLNYDWEHCFGFSWVDTVSTVLPWLKEFMANGLRVWVYNGDTDGRVPVTSTQYSLNEMELETMIEWYPWTHKKQIAGYTEVYKGGLTFATVRGAGHEVPSFQPDRALALISHFLSGKPLPKYNLSSDVHY